MTVGGNLPRLQPSRGEPAHSITASPPALDDAIQAFLLSRRAANCSPRTLEIYARNLMRFGRVVGNWRGCTPVAVQTYLTGLGVTLKAISTHQHFRTLKTFFTWCVELGLIPEHPMRGVAMKVPKILPRVPDDDQVRRLLGACRDTFEGRRNKALIAVLADSGIRISEALRLRIEDLNFAARTISIYGGKGQKDGLGFFGATTASLLRAWLAKCGEIHTEDFLFTDRKGQPLTRYGALRILHRLSVRAGLPRKVGPHALRHYAATTILRQTGDLELVRQVLRHESLAMTLRYAHLARPDLSAKFRRASPLDNLRAGR